MPPDRAVDHARQRRDPASCQSCRVKKLKCDRQRPCSNCTTRRIACQYRSGPPALKDQAPRPSSAIDLYAENIALKTRVQRLEQVVFGNDSPKVPPEPATTASSSTISVSDHVGDGAALDSERLEGIGNRFADVSPCIAESLQVTICSANEFLEDASDPWRTSFPELGVTLAYLAAYERHVDAVQPIMHIPSVREMIMTIYEKLYERKAVPSGSVALILAICAYADLLEVHQPFQFIESASTARASSILMKKTMDVVEHARMSSQISVELVQATILLIFHLGHIEGISVRPRLLHSSAVTMARSLGLHRIDSPTRKSAGDTRAQVIEAEIGRRIWWHLASSDWLFAFLGGPHGGVYSIQKHQMVVDKPRHINNEDLSMLNAEFQRPDDEPTIMTFYLQRVRLASICRDVVDALPIVLEPQQVQYDTIVMLDAKFGALIDGLPKAMELDSSVECIESESGAALNGQLILQRAITNLLIYTRRCKLHLPFLIRSRSDPRYLFSRQKCLESARKVFQARQSLQTTEQSVAQTAVLRLGCIVGHVLYATTVLVIDACVNNSGAIDAKQIAEVRAAVILVEQIKDSSEIASVFWESLMDVLHKHQVKHPLIEKTNGIMSDKEKVMATGPPKAETTLPESRSQVADCYADEVMNDSSGFEDIWQHFLYNESAIDLQSWDALINDLEMRTV